MKKVAWRFVSVLLVLVVSFGFATSLVSVKVAPRTPLRAWLVNNFDVAGTFTDHLEILVKDSDLDILKKAGISYKTIVDDVESRLSARMVRGYRTYEEMVAALKKLAKDHPEITKLEVIGKSAEGREIYAIKISDNPNVDEDEPSALIMGLHHAREWIAAEVPMRFAEYLVNNYGKDKKVTELVNGREIWVVPIVNPDGYVYSMTKYTMWRKTRRHIKDNYYGVDPNRNYGYQWGSVGTSDWPGSDTYHGPHAFSEPETQAIRDFAKREHFWCSVSFHSYGELNLYPYGYAYKAYAPDNDLLKELAEGMAKFNGHKPEKSSDLYPAMGDSDDWLYHDCHTLSFTLELGRRFIPDQSQIDEISQKNIKALLWLVDVIKEKYQHIANTTEPEEHDNPNAGNYWPWRHYVKKADFVREF